MSKDKSNRISKSLQQELAYILRRIENNIDLRLNIELLWQFCTRNQIDSDYLLTFLKKTMLKPNIILQKLQQHEEKKAAVSNEKKICIITCVNDLNKYKESLLYLNNSHLPAEYAIEYIPIYGAKSLASGYQEGMCVSSAKYKVYIHQDACLINPNALSQMITLFQAHPDIGMFGFAGCTKLPSSGVWYETQERGYGVVAQATEPDKLVRLGFAKTTHDYETVEAIDGVFIMTQYDVHWRDDIFTGWDFYDISQAMEFRRHGWKVAVPGSNDIWCVHDSGIDFDTDAYEHWRKIFVKEYSDML